MNSAVLKKSTFCPGRPSPSGRGKAFGPIREGDVLALIDNNFDTWDRNSDGRITWSEMRKNVADPTIKGKEAAALATLYSSINDATAERGRVRKLPVTTELLEDWKDDREFAQDEGEDFAADLYFQRYLGKLEQASTELFADNLPNAFSISQGYGPSCAFLATTTAQARINPHVIVESIHERPDHKLEVKFPGLHKPVVIAPTTDTETALFASAGKNGTWLNSLEKAWGTLESKNPLAAFETASWPAKSIRAWSGGDAVTTSVPKKLEEWKSGEIPSFLEDARKELASNHIVVTWTRNGERTLENLVVGHAHTLTGIDPDAGTVELRNPWGHREPLDVDGKPRDGRDDGVFEVTFQEYVRDFGRIAMQTNDKKVRRS